MNGQESTGGELPAQQQATTQTAFDYEQVSGERWAPGLETVGSRSTGESRRRFTGTPTSVPHSLSRQVPERSLRKRRLYLTACLEALESLRDNASDPIHKDNALAEVKNQLQALWELVDGNPNSEAFEEMIQTLQVAFCDETAVSLQPRHLDAVASVLVKLREDPDVSDDSANDLTMELIGGGIDVFREIG